MRTFTRFLVVAIVLAALVGCGKSGGSGSSPASGGSSAAAAASSAAPTDVTGKKNVVIEMNDNYFQPSVLKGTPGQTIQIELKNVGMALHNFSLSEPGLSLGQDIQPGGDQFVTVKFPQSGSVQFYCKYHKSMGMVGTLSVG